MGWLHSVVRIVRRTGRPDRVSSRCVPSLGDLLQERIRCSLHAVGRKRTVLNQIVQEAFIPGAVTKKLLKDVAAEASEIRINNMPENPAPVRSVPEAIELIEILLEKPGFYISLVFSNCVQFIFYLKFADAYRFEPMNMLMSLRSHS